MAKVSLIRLPNESDAAYNARVMKAAADGNQAAQIQIASHADSDAVSRTVRRKADADRPDHDIEMTGNDDGAVVFYDRIGGDAMVKFTTEGVFYKDASGEWVMVKDGGELRMRFMLWMDGAEEALKNMTKDAGPKPPKIAKKKKKGKRYAMMEVQSSKDKIAWVGRPKESLPFWVTEPNAVNDMMKGCILQSEDGGLFYRAVKAVEETRPKGVRI